MRRCPSTTMAEARKHGSTLTLPMNIVAVLMDKDSPPDTMMDHQRDKEN
jgi:hypothetical protein